MKKKNNIKYGTHSRHMLDVYYHDEKDVRPVLFFVHGGSWMTGNKDMYTQLAENFYDIGFVSVIINYRLYPEKDVYGMAQDCIDALQWCKENIKNFGGDEKKIYLTGHSAGGQLCAVAGLSEKDPLENIAGFIIIDAFGLSANHFLTKHQEFIPEFFAGLFGHEKDRWPLASPDKLVRKDHTPPVLILTGGNTYPYITYDADNFMTVLNEMNVYHQHDVIPDLTHMQMICEFENRSAKVYQIIMKWLNKAEIRK